MSDSRSMTPAQARREALEALAYLLDASDGAASGYIPGSEDDDKWCRRLEDAREDARQALAQAEESHQSAAALGLERDGCTAGAAAAVPQAEAAAPGAVEGADIPLDLSQFDPHRGWRIQEAEALLAECKRLRAEREGMVCVPASSLQHWADLARINNHHHVYGEIEALLTAAKERT